MTPLKQSSGHALWVLTERMRSRIPVVEMSFHCKVSGLPFILEELTLELKRAS